MGLMFMSQDIGKKQVKAIYWAKKQRLSDPT